MSLRHGLLALLEAGPRHGSQLRAVFEEHTGGAWPLSLGRVCTTLGLLERDGLVAREGVDGAGRVTYALTRAGRTELRSWYARPMELAGPPREELALKLVLADAAPEVEVREVVDVQRRHVSEALHDYVRQRAELLARRPGRPGEVARLLVLEQLICHAEAESRWLEHCAARLLRLHPPQEPGRPARNADGAHTVDHLPQGAPRR
ncbi:PadR family transcriptional regulator [Streptomyces sp. MK5]|uniref:PadR family transcriptional regulator n=1 Tax=Streptomyces sp. MK5 TaxID=3064253 RepID=UPI0027412A19|nr:PadR family transcriptional regulator [Streptomyces sp. MK5]